MLKFTEYMDMRRAMFPRTYFLSNRELLQLMAAGGDPSCGPFGASPPSLTSNASQIVAASDPKALRRRDWTGDCGRASAGRSCAECHRRAPAAGRPRHHQRHGRRLARRT
jgi:hypothetical protein